MAKCDGSTPGMKKIQLLERLINMMETNKNQRTGLMFEERKNLSKVRE